jgi:hypothetical protein
MPEPTTICQLSKEATSRSFPSSFAFLFFPDFLSSLGQKRTLKSTATAHGCLNQPAQENPLEGEAQPDENPLLETLSDEPHEKEDICLHVSFSPQQGQTGFISPSEGKTSCSNTFSHLLHLNS